MNDFLGIWFVVRHEVHTYSNVGGKAARHKQGEAIKASNIYDLLFFCHAYGSL